MRTVIAFVFCFAAVSAAAADRPTPRSAPNASYQALSREAPTSPATIAAKQRSAWAWQVRRDRAIALQRAQRERAEALASK